jgi:hypothetical protein
MFEWVLKRYSLISLVAIFSAAPSDSPKDEDTLLREEERLMSLFAALKQLPELVVMVLSLIQSLD